MERACWGVVDSWGLTVEGSEVRGQGSGFGVEIG